MVLIIVGIEIIECFGRKNLPSIIIALTSKHRSRIANLKHGTTEAKVAESVGIEIRLLLVTETQVIGVNKLLIPQANPCTHVNVF